MCVFLRFRKHVGEVCSSSGDIPNLAVPKSADVVEMQCFRGCHAFLFLVHPIFFDCIPQLGFTSKTFWQDRMKCYCLPFCSMFSATEAGKTLANKEIANIWKLSKIRILRQSNMVTPNCNIV